MKSRAKFLFLIFVLLSTFTVNKANSLFDAASNALTAKLQEDLADSRIELKIAKAHTYTFSKNVIGLKGEGTTEGLKINFDIKLTKDKFIPKSIDYTIAENENLNASFEDKLSRQLLNKLNKDLKTTSITIAIDNYDNSEANMNQLSTTGIGEVSINAEWKKIKFEVIKDKKSDKVMKVNYELY